MRLYRDVIQLSPEWHALRSGSLSGSRASLVVGSPKSAAAQARGDLVAAGMTYARRCAAALAAPAHAPRPVTFANGEHGRYWEPIAREAASLDVGIDFAEVGWAERTDAHGHSPDGLADGVGLEVKCQAEPAIYEACAAWRAPADVKPHDRGKWYWQCVNGMVVCGVTRWLLASYLYRTGELSYVLFDADSDAELAADLAHLLERAERFAEIRDAELARLAEARMGRDQHQEAIKAALRTPASRPIPTLTPTLTPPR